MFLRQTKSTNNDVKVQCNNEKAQAIKSIRLTGQTLTETQHKNKKQCIEQNASSHLRYLLRLEQHKDEKVNEKAHNVPARHEPI